MSARLDALGIYLLAFGYFACYVPYSALTKAISGGHMTGVAEAVPGPTLLPLSLGASVVGMLIFLTVMRWWRYASTFRVGSLVLPRPGLWTGLSGLATATIVATTTLAYTFEGVSIVFVMLLMRGGVLVMAPLVDAISRRRTRWFSWAGLVLSLAALLVAFSEEGGYLITAACALDVALYLAAYFARLRFMSRLAKSDRTTDNIRFFVEEQMVATPAVFTAMALVAAFGTGGFAQELATGFTGLWDEPWWPLVVLIGVLSQGTGIFGGLILLDRRENTFCVPINRSSSILAGVVASFSLAALLDLPAPSAYELGGAALVIVAILFLTLPPLAERRRAAGRVA